MALDNNLNMYAWGLDQVDLDDYGVDDGEFTLFGPVDDGFDSGFMSDIQVAKEIVKYHVVRGYFELEDLSNGQELETVLLGKSTCGTDKLVVKKEGGETYITGAGIEAKITTADLLTCGSVIHIVDKLLVPCPARLAAVVVDEDDDDGFGDDDDGTADNDDDDGDDNIDDNDGNDDDNDDDFDDNDDDFNDNDDDFNDNDDDFDDNDDDGRQMPAPTRTAPAVVSDDVDDDGDDNDDN